VIVVAVAVAIVSFTSVTPSYADARNQPDPLLGWTHSTAFSDDTSQRHGIVLSGREIQRGSPVIAEVDGNTSNGKEVVVGGIDGRVYAYHANGSPLWEQNVPIVGCSPVNPGGVTLINGKPTVGPLFGGNTPYVLIGYGTILNTNRACDGGVVVYRGDTGQQVWNFSQRNFDNSYTPEGPEALYGVISAPALADADGNGTLEVAFGGLDRNLYMLNNDGSVRWYYHAADTVWATPLFINIDGDSALELIAPTDIAANSQVIPPTSSGGFVYAFDTQQRTPVNITFQTGFIWRTYFDQAIYSSPLAANLLDSNAGLEIAVGSSCYWPEASTNKNGKWIKILRPSDGAVLQTLNAPACVQSSPAVGDIDEDGALEIVATVSGAAAIGGDGKSDIVAWDPTNPNPKWSTSTGDPNSGDNDPYGGDLQSPVIADLDGNGSLEVIAANHWSVHVLKGKTGTPLTCQSLSCGSPISLFAWYTLKSTPAVGDINNDGKLDLVIGGGNNLNLSHGQLYAWTNFAGVLKLNSDVGTLPAYSAPWPQFRRDALASGIFIAPGLSVTNSSGAIITPSDTETINLMVNSADGVPLNWSASITQNQDGLLSLNNNSGTTGSILQFQINGNGRANGTYTGTIQVSAPSVSSVNITVTAMVVSTVYKVSLPLVIH